MTEIFISIIAHFPLENNNLTHEDEYEGNEYSHVVDSWSQLSEYCIIIIIYLWTEHDVQKNNYK